VARLISWVLACMCATVAYAGQGSLEPWSWPLTDAHRQAAAVLRECRKADESTLVRLQTELRKQEPLLREALLDILVRARVPEVSATDAPQVLSEPQRACVLHALRASDPKVLRATLAVWSQEEALQPGVSLAALHVLAEIGNRDDLVALSRLAPRKLQALVEGEGAAPIAALTREGRTALREACAGILHRDPEAWSMLAGLMTRVDEPTAKVMLEAVGSLQNPRALPVLARVARTQRDLVSHALAQVPKVGPTTETELAAEFAAWIASQLPFARGEQVRLYAQALASLDEGTHVAVLVECLAGDAAAQDAGHQALRHITGVDFGLDADAWTAWMQTDRAWHDERRPVLAEDLVSADLGRVVTALHEYAQHRTRKSELIQDLAAATQDERDVVRELVVRILRTYEHPRAQSLLVELGLQP